MERQPFTKKERERERGKKKEAHQNDEKNEGEGRWKGGLNLSGGVLLTEAWESSEERRTEVRSGPVSACYSQNWYIHNELTMEHVLPLDADRRMVTPAKDHE